MKDTNDSGFVRTEGGILPLVLPNPQTAKEYEALLFAKPIPANAFYLSKEMLNEINSNPAKYNLVPSGGVQVSSAAKSFLEDEVKNATLATMMGSVTIRN